MGQLEPINQRGASLAKTNRLFWTVIAGIILYLVLDTIVQSLPPHYSPISQPESDLAVGTYGYVMGINFINRGAFSLIFAYALIQSLDFLGVMKGRYLLGIFGIATWGASSLLLAVFPTDVPATPVSWHGAIHLILAVLAFAGGAFGELSMSMQLGHDSALRGARKFALPIAVLAVIFFLALFGLPVARPHIASEIGGLVERLLIGSVILWMGAMSAFMLRRKATSTAKV